VHTNPHPSIDRLGGLWLRSNDRTSDRVARVRIDPATLAMDMRVLPCGMQEVVDVIDEHTLLVRTGPEISRVDTDTGARTLLFPRPR
jgi:hypothetical protein